MTKLFYRNQYSDIIYTRPCICNVLLKDALIYSCNSYEVYWPYLSFLFHWPGLSLCLSLSHSLEYEAVDSYKAENDDEIELSAGDKVVVLHKNMDGWWKIKYTHMHTPLLVHCTYSHK